LEAPWLYRINLFGPEYVAKLGRERLLNTPAWQVKELDDGGILVATIPYMEAGVKEPGAAAYDWGKAAQHLGLAEPRIIFLDRRTYERT
jgi:hypothetical protein